MKVLERGIPDDAMVGILNIKVHLSIRALLVISTQAYLNRFNFYFIKFVLLLDTNSNNNKIRYNIDVIYYIQFEIIVRT